ncbi:MAG: hypothetical protein ACUVR8_05385 [Acidobacteriota bacterium]
MRTVWAYKANSLHAWRFILHRSRDANTPAAYVLRAKAGQTLTFAASWTKPLVGVLVYDVDVYDVGGAAPLDGTSGHPVRTGEVVLPATGDYFLYVLTESGLVPKAGIKYSLTVEVR